MIDEPITEPDLDSTVDTELDAGEAVDELLETDNEGVEEVAETDQGNQPDNPEAQPVLKAHVKHILNSMRSQKFKFGEMVFEVKYVNVGQKRFSATLLNPVVDSPTPEMLERLRSQVEKMKADAEESEPPAAE